MTALTNGQWKVRPGARFDRLIVVARAGLLVSRHQKWACVCDCGNESVVDASNLRSGHTTSCGCKVKEAASSRTHGLSHTPTHTAWTGMIGRCENPKNSAYDRYGGRGIRICRRWRESFETFLADMGPKPSAGHSLDRINNDGDYEPGNVRWATVLEQSNNKRTSRTLTHGGRTLSIADWGRATGIKADTIRGRLRYGWTVDRALTEDVP